ncbi:Zinc finger, FYVE/PHD-type [Pseudocohnilembus persalinus]|uniref:Zinc finger, FYVE/PHD-type n=1 Tax=Pseudocohnilembus persalinus TaxID=266149 RepID=A0A0V0QLW7_PSEPJ|nr:Zinc finger, FYVE/PHD-type [Pseudocohnilembus persalinus]|eukprot:KRX03243.1 Zinc finger, FYVE/PHD-type [Pseudocohnilembus persalinus]
MTKKIGQINKILYFKMKILILIKYMIYKITFQVQRKRLQKMQDVISRNKELGEQVSQVCCTICLGEAENKIFADLACNHKFCFDCIFDWAQVTNLCPMCRQEFRQIKKIDLNKGKETYVSVKKKKQRVNNDDDEFFDEENYDVENLDETCYVCKSSENEQEMLICDDCQFHICHVNCDDEIRDGRIPQGNWFCHECRGRGSYMDMLLERNQERTTLNDQNYDEDIDSIFSQE